MTTCKGDIHFKQAIQIMIYIPILHIVDWAPTYYYQVQISAKLLVEAPAGRPVRHEGWAHWQLSKPSIPVSSRNSVRFKPEPEKERPIEPIHPNPPAASRRLSPEMSWLARSIATSLSIPNDSSTDDDPDAATTPSPSDRIPHPPPLPPYP
jgi:hypothetical protein